MELRQAITVHIRINLHTLKFYETLSQKLERILRMKDPEQMKLDLRALVEEMNQQQAEMEAKSLTKIEYSLLLEAQDALNLPEEQLIPFIKDLTEKLKPLTFPGWSLRTDNYRAVQRTIFTSLHEHYGQNVQAPIKLLELRDEFMKWLERDRA